MFTPLDTLSYLEGQLLLSNGVNSCVFVVICKNLEKIEKFFIFFRISIDDMRISVRMWSIRGQAEG